MNERDKIEVTNPFSGERVGSASRGTAADIDRTVRIARSGAEEMRRMPLHRRAAILTGSAALATTEAG